MEIVPADMANDESRKKIVQVAKEKFGGLDVLILNHVMIDEESALDISYAYHKIK